LGAVKLQKQKKEEAVVLVLWAPIPFVGKNNVTIGMKYCP
jgi:hypothetical protein